MSTTLDLELFLLGLPAAGFSRLAPDDRLPLDTTATGRIPAGARVELISDGCELEIDYELAAQAHDLACTSMPDGFSVWVDGSPMGVHHVERGRPGTLRLSCPAGRVQIYTPESYQPRVTALRLGRGRASPVPRAPLWTAYGDSITQGWSATDPGRTYVALAARSADLNPVNLGFAASARGELPVAEQIAAQKPAVVSIAFGTNCWSRLPMSGDTVAGTLCDFIALIRHVNPQVPVVVVSPLVRPDAERTRNAVGATLEDLRHAIEHRTQLLSGGDENVHLVGGRSLVDVSELADGLHPDDAGHRTMATALVPVLHELVAPVRPTTTGR